MRTGETEPPATYELHDAERVTVRRHTPEVLEVAAEWAAGEHPPLPHLHPHQDERFEVHEGELTVDLDGKRHVLRPGDTLDVPRGTRHRMFNSGGSTARATWQVMPAGRTAEFWAAIHEARKTKPTDAHGMLTPPAAAPILREYRDVFRLGLPDAVARPALAALSAVARLRGI